jgi:hypothetical protein
MMIDGYAYDKTTYSNPLVVIEDWQATISSLEKRAPPLTPAANALRQMLACVHPDQIAKVKPAVRQRNYETLKKKFEAAYLAAAPKEPLEKAVP